ncbi:MAG: HD domain-containing protein [Fimbriimonadaceae bacterium]|nr:HD domain-containing protein [Fimbriimonadaceae bacterium]
MRYPRLAEATLWAAELHRDEEREGNDPLPYVYHPADVVRRLYKAGVRDEDVLVAGALHDAVESGATTVGAIALRFGPVSAGLVGEMTRTEPSEAQIADMNPEEVAALRADMLLEDVRRMSATAHQIKLADRLSNLAEAQRTRAKRGLERYVRQSQRILDAIPRDAQPALWDALQKRIRRARKSTG